MAGRTPHYRRQVAAERAALAHRSRLSTATVSGVFNSRHVLQ